MHVVSPGRHLDIEFGLGTIDVGGVRGEPERSEQPHDLLRREPQAEQPTNARHAQANDPRWLRRPSHPNSHGVRRTACRSDDELDATPNCSLHASLVDAPLEPIGSVGRQPRVLGCGPSMSGIKPGALDEHVRGVSGDLAVPASHDTGQGDGPFRVGDDRHGRRQLVFTAVECLQALTRRRPPNPDLGSRDARQVERVQRLVRLQQHIVRRIDDVVDRPGSGGPQL